MSKNSELYWKKTMLRGLENFENLRNVGNNKINIQGVSLNKWKLHLSKLLKEDRTEFLNRITEKGDDKNTDNIHLDIEIVEIAICSLKNGSACGEGKPTGNKLLGRLRHRLEDNIRMDLKEIGINTRNWVDSAQDKD